jgi:uncharacterized protein
MVKLGIEVPQEAIVDFCHKHSIRKFSFFGSVLGDSFGPDSDIDVLVEFEPGHVPGYALIQMQKSFRKSLEGAK